MPRFAVSLALALLCSWASPSVGTAMGPAAGSGTGATADLPTAGSRPAPAERDPLTVHIAAITPATLSDDDRPLTITGTVTNASEEQWRAINLYSFRSAAPIVDATSLAASAAVEPGAFVGDRIVTPGTEDSVDVLDPGQSAEFTLTVPRSEIAVTEAGVYWLGVHAMGDSSVPRDQFADGRARTFIPLVPRRRGSDPAVVDAALVVPIRETVWHRADGRVARVGRWARSLAEGGRLHSILGTDDGTTGVPLTWLIDPAVPAAVARLAAGNPPRSLAPDPAAEPTPEPDETPSEEPAPTTGATSSGVPARAEPFTTLSDPIPPPEPDRELSEDEQALADVAQAWLDRFAAATAGQTVLALPYGDLDVSAAAAHGPTYYQQAVTRSSQVMAWLGVAATPALAPRDGILSPAALEAATPDSTILVADTSFAVPPDAPEAMVRLLQHKVVVTSGGAAAGGPGPTPAADPLAIRQRLLSEAALRLQSGTSSPVVVMLPADWRPVDPAALLVGLDEPWLDVVGVADITERSARAMNAAGLAYTDEDRIAELDATNFSSTDQFSARADLLAGVLTQQNLVRQQVADEALTSLSAGHRDDPARATDSVEAADGFLADQLASITVDAPGAVTLSSESGNLGADVVNGLDQPVTVRVGVQSDGALQLEDQGVLQLSANARTRILPRVTADRPGIHQVRLIVTDAQGQPLGAATSLQIRAAQVSGLIWLLIAAGALLLFGTIAIRLVRRIRGSGPSTTGRAE